MSYYSLLVFTLMFGISSSQNSKNTQQNEPLQIEYCKLVNEGSTTMIGRTIQVRAIYRYGFENSSLQTPNCCPSNNNLDTHVSLSELDKKSIKLLDKAPKYSGLILGTFEAVVQSDRGNNKIKLLITRIIKIEATSKISVNKPSWYPQKCD